jgi:hypothetical protein
VVSGGTWYLAFQNDNTSRIEIDYATSSNGVTWTNHGALVAPAFDAYTPDLFLNPNDSKFYLYYATGNGINVRSAATVAGLTSAADVTVFTPGNSLYDTASIYAPNVIYDSATSTYLLEFEDLMGTNNTVCSGLSCWNIVLMTSSNPTSGFSQAPGNPQQTNGMACPNSFNASGTLYTFYCHWNGSAFVIPYTTATIASGRKAWNAPNNTIWTVQNITGETTPPSWSLVPCTNWLGVSATCLEGFGKYSAETNGYPGFLKSSYSSTDYIVNARVQIDDGQDNLGAVARITGTSGQAYEVGLYTTGELYGLGSPPYFAIGSGASQAFAYNTWYHVELTVHGTTVATSFNDGTKATSGADSSYSSGSAGAGIDPGSWDLWGTIFVRQYAVTVPTNAVGAETSGSY